MASPYLHALSYFETMECINLVQRQGPVLHLLRVTFLVLLFSVQTQAQYKILQMSPPAVKKHLKSQLTRMDDIRKYKFSGFIGEADTGLLAVREIKTLSKEEQKKITKLVDEENNDRKQIYAILSKHNKLSEKEKVMLIKSAFETYKNMDSKKTYHFENKKWQQKF